MTDFQETIARIRGLAGSRCETGEVIRQGARIIAEHIPLQLLLLRHFDATESVMTTEGGTDFPSGQKRPVERTTCRPEQVDRLRRWARDRKTWNADAATARNSLPGLLPGELHGPLLVAPLDREGEFLGALVIQPAEGLSFDAKHCRLLETLLEPFSTALWNSRHLPPHEGWGEATEQNSGSASFRISRQDISDSVIGSETGLRTVSRYIEQVSRSDTPVLLLGETGSGKELAARSIHLQSRRSAGPFLRVNCGAIPPDLVDSQLFGHERGSFTGATGSHKGWFERADSGTLFLDEIGELPLAAQVRLLRILQDGTFERVGGQQQLTVDVRVVAATHLDLKQMVQNGRFREDLWYRIAVFPIALPPLRERTEDIPALATHFAIRFAKHLGVQALTPTGEDIRRLLEYRWPGNVRELAAVMERAVILGNGRSLAVSQALGIEGDVGLPPAAPPPKAAPGQPAAKTFPSLDEVVRKHIETALGQTKGRVEGPEGAAALLRINPHTLRARMRKLGIDWQQFRTKTHLTEKVWRNAFHPTEAPP